MSAARTAARLLVTAMLLVLLALVLVFARPDDLEGLL